MVRPLVHLVALIAKMHSVSPGAKGSSDKHEIKKHLKIANALRQPHQPLWPLPSIFPECTSLVDILISQKSDK